MDLHPSLAEMEHSVGRRPSKNSGSLELASLEPLKLNLRMLLVIDCMELIAVLMDHLDSGAAEPRLAGFASS